MAVSTVFDIPAATAALKELYDDQTVQNLVYSDNPFLAMIPKHENFSGKNYPLPIQIGNSQGRATTVANAQSGLAAALLKEFFLTRVKDYSIAQLDNETMLASASDIGSFVRGSKVTIDSAIGALKNSMAAAAMRSGTGSIAQISSISTGVITLTNADDVAQIEVNMTLQANATDGGGSPRAAGFVIAVDRVAGIVTVASSGLGGVAATPASWQANDFLLVNGDNNAKMTGLAGWLPGTNATSTSFFGVDRTVDKTRLAGIFTDQGALSLEEAQIKATQLAGREGAKIGVGIVNFTSFAALQAALGSKVVYASYTNGQIAFRGITVNGATGPIDLFPDRNCPAQTEWLLQLNTWGLYSLGPAPRILTYDDGAMMMRVSNADTMELRVGMYGQIGCNAPGWNVQCKLAV